ncbi:cAMP and cAMP-inhibited cGMP 3',5'-cyclic phosphodiesterase 10A-like [Centruroides vittatus]|uniref:cAMP and cAMP-inhibited cGMP 3',5'-cyclic phosphodiesterase 10A-like n=1 Tax=Centruroides vittatus TaxID=120091 RepID=UPI00350F4E0F
MPHKSRYSCANTLTVREIINWLRHNSHVKDDILSDAIMNFLLHHEELFETYVERNISLKTVQQWLNIMIGEPKSDTTNEYFNSSSLCRDLYCYIQNGDKKMVLSEFCFVLQEILKSDDLTIELCKELSSDNITLTSKAKTVLTYSKNSMKIDITSNYPHYNMVIKIYRRNGIFSKNEYDIVKFISDSLMACFSLCGDSLERCNNCMPKEFFPQLRLLTIDKNQTTVIIPKILMRIKSFLSADRVNLFIFKEKTNELVAKYFDLGDVIVKSKISCQMGKGFCGTCASSGKLLNIVDCTKESRYSNEVLKMIGCEVKNIICYPIISSKKLFGVLQGLKFFHPPFNDQHETIVRCMAPYCSFLLHLEYLYDLNKQKTNCLSISSEMLHYHIQKNNSIVKTILKNPSLEVIPRDIDTIHFKYIDISIQEIPKLFIYLCDQLLGINNYPLAKLCNFIITVIKCYRQIPYHNIFHAFNVTHCMYLMIKGNRNIFSIIEMKAMIIACICHDIDHRGFNNSYHSVTKSPFAILYTKSILERHHFDTTIFILQEDQNNVLCDLSTLDYKFVLSSIESLILSTDFASFHHNKRNLTNIIKSKDFKIPDIWSNLDNRTCLKKIMMAGCDLSGVCKPWTTVVAIVKQIYAEFYNQGDKEKEIGIHPNSMMDRDSQDRIPEDQIKFLKYICIPIYEKLAICLPNTKPILEACRRCLQQWQRYTRKINMDLVAQENISLQKKNKRGIEGMDLKIK